MHYLLRTMGRLSDQLHRVNKFLEYLETKTTLDGDMQGFSDLQCHLFEQLIEPGSKLDQSSFLATKDLVDQNVKFSRVPLALELLPHILELLHARVEKEVISEILDELWKTAYDFQPAKIFSSYIQPFR